MFFFNPISLKPALQHYGKLDEVQDALENDHDVFSLWNFEDTLLSKAIKTGNSVRMKNILRKALRGEDIKLVVLGGSNSAGGLFRSGREEFRWIILQSLYQLVE